MGSLAGRIIRALAGDRDIVNMAFAQTCRRNSNKPRARLKFRYVGSSDITHGGAQSANQLVQDHRGRTAIRHLSLDTLGYELQLVGDVLLEIAVRRTTRHRADRPHATICFERTALIKIDLA